MKVPSLEYIQANLLGIHSA